MEATLKQKGDNGPEEEQEGYGARWCGRWIARAKGKRTRTRTRRTDRLEVLVRHRPLGEDQTALRRGRPGTGSAGMGPLWPTSWARLPTSACSWPAPSSSTARTTARRTITSRSWSSDAPEQQVRAASDRAGDRQQAHEHRRRRLRWPQGGRGPADDQHGLGELSDLGPPEEGLPDSPACRLHHAASRKRTSRSRISIAAPATRAPPISITKLSAAAIPARRSTIKQPTRCWPCGESWRRSKRPCPCRRPDHRDRETAPAPRALTPGTPVEETAPAPRPLPRETAPPPRQLPPNLGNGQ